jgi:hypothetical protein
MSTPVISREEARRRGLKYYFTAAMCPRGHVALRFTSTRGCTQCIREGNRKRWLKQAKRKIAKQQRDPVRLHVGDIK